MKQFGKIFKFELKNYFTNKIFVGITAFLVVVIVVLMFLPRIIGLSDGENEALPPENLPKMIISGEGAELAADMFKSAFPEYEVSVSADGIDRIKEKITAREVECAFVLNGLTSYSYYVNNLSMYDNNTAVANEVLVSVFRLNAMVNGGILPDDAANILSASIEGETVNLGKDQMQNFFYTYIMIFALYMVILLYGQMVATNVATEKSSRAMELLITSVKPNAMMFGKVLASCFAGFCQLVLVFGSALFFYDLNKEYWSENIIIQSIFNMPIELFFYMLLFFVLGFLMYAFMFGAIGSTASKLEDINTSVMPITLLFVVGFIVVITSMAGGNIDNGAMKVCSYIPFTSPMAMFTRIAMSIVPAHEVIISVAILIVSVFVVGIISAKIYRVGVLLYGTPPKLRAILKAVRKS